jgi:hypothetical protein
MTTQQWRRGDIFLVPNADLQYTLGQVLGLERRTLLSAACAFFDERIASRESADSLCLDPNQCFAALLVTPDGLDEGVWPVVGHRPVTLSSRLYPYGRSLAIRRFWSFFGLGLSLLTRKLPNPKIHGSGNVSEFINAFYGLRAWDDWFDPNYLDTLLLSPEKKPKKLVLLHSTPNV